jgi:hypothetical protein
VFAQRASSLPILTADSTKYGKVFNLITEKTSIIGVFDMEVILLLYRTSTEEGVLSSEARFGLVVQSPADLFHFWKHLFPLKASSMAFSSEQSFEYADADLRREGRYRAFADLKLIWGYFPGRCRWALSLARGRPPGAPTTISVSARTPSPIHARSHRSGWLRFGRHGQGFRHHPLPRIIDFSPTDTVYVKARNDRNK